MIYNQLFGSTVATWTLAPEVQGECCWKHQSVTDLSEARMSTWTSDGHLMGI